AFVDVVELLDQRVDARLIEPQRLHLADDLVPELLVAALLRGRERIVAQLVLDVLVLQAAQALVGIGNVGEGLDHLGLEFGFDGGKRHRVFYIVLVEIAFAGRNLALRSGRVVTAGRVGVCANTEGPPPAPWVPAAAIGWPSEPIAGAGITLAS